MAKKTAPLLPATDDLLRRFADRLRLARLRRRLSAKQVAERAGMSPMTLRSLEQGGSGVTIGAYLSVMQVLGIEKDIDLLGKADPLGRELQDAQLPARARTPMREPAEPVEPVDPPASTTTASKAKPKTSAKTKTKTGVAAKQTDKSSKPAIEAGDWMRKGTFASSDALASLIAPTPAARKRAH
jgi:transcriptional regulator with XRE-family HTH domain